VLRTLHPDDAARSPASDRERNPLLKLQTGCAPSDVQSATEPSVVHSAGLSAVARGSQKSARTVAFCHLPQSVSHPTVLRRERAAARRALQVFVPKLAMCHMVGEALVRFGGTALAFRGSAQPLCCRSLSRPLLLPHRLGLFGDEDGTFDNPKLPAAFRRLPDIKILSFPIDSGIDCAGSAKTS
jgi:hypothetical protein